MSNTVAPGSMASWHRLGQDGRCVLDDVRQFEDDTAHAGVDLKDAGQQRPDVAADVDDGAEPPVVIGCDEGAVVRRASAVKKA